MNDPDEHTLDEAWGEDPADGDQARPTVEDGCRAEFERLSDGLLRQTRLNTEAIERALRAEAALERVEALCGEWAARAPGDDWGDSMADTVLADAGRAVLAALSEVSP